MFLPGVDSPVISTLGRLSGRDIVQVKGIDFLTVNEANGREFEQRPILFGVDSEFANKLAGGHLI